MMYWNWRIQTRKFPINPRSYEKILNKAAEHLSIDGWTVTIVLASDAFLSRLKKKYLNQEGSTDVLAFPMHEKLPNGEIYLGDIAVSVNTANRQAKLHGHSLSDEITILLLHGFLHLLGYDHETDQGEMVALEAKLRDMLLTGQKSHA